MSYHYNCFIKLNINNLLYEFNDTSIDMIGETLIDKGHVYCLYYIEEYIKLQNFVEFDAENFDSRLKSIKPRVAFSVPNVLNDDGGNIAVDITFNNMEDFSPDKVAEKVEGVKQLLDARKQLANLLSYMDGKSGAEELLGKLLEDPALLKALSAKAKEEMEKAMAKHCKEVYLNHLQDPVGVQAMSMLVFYASDKEFVSLYEQGGECIHADARIAGRYESLTASRRTVIQLDTAGKDFIETKGDMSDYIGHGSYVLVDFWASWCGPCREETPFVVKAYNDYKDKGLVVLGIPVQDKSDATKEAMRQLGIHYPQLLDPGDALAEEYGVTGIPHLFLFGPDGKVLQDGMRGEGIDAVLKPIFQK